MPPVPGKRFLLRVDDAVIGKNWHGEERHSKWGSFRWTGPGNRATLNVPIGRDREVFVAICCPLALLDVQWTRLQVEVDGKQVPHSLRKDLFPGYIVLLVPRRPFAGSASTEIALIVSRTVSPSSLTNNSPDDRLLGLAVSSAAVVPLEPALPRQAWASGLERLRARLGSPATGALLRHVQFSHFDGIGYLEAHPDVATAVARGTVLSALDHYRKFGRKQKRSLILAAGRLPNEGVLADFFDGAAYLNLHADVADSVRRGVMPSGLEHYLRHGRKERRRFSMRFDGQASLGTMMDLAQRSMDARIQSTVGGRLDALQHGLEQNARGSRETMEQVQEQLLTLARARQTREREFLAQIEALKAHLALAQENASVAARASDLERLKRDVSRDLDRVRDDISSALNMRETREQAVLAHIEMLKAAIGTSQARAELAEIKIAAAERELEIRTGQIIQSAKQSSDRLDQLQVDLSSRDSLRESMETAIRAEIELLKGELSVAQAGHTLTTGRANDSENRQPARSWSQLGQDLWVIERAGHRTEGYFVDIGATDGVLLNNTYLLETRHAWKGICVEPDPVAFNKLSRNRKARCSNTCLWSVSGEEHDFILAKEYGSIAKIASLDNHSSKRAAYKRIGETIKVRTTSLNDLLEGLGAPAIIDYISLDTEGSEYEILRTFDFNRWKVALWTIEHNHAEQRERIFSLMSAHGYKRREVQFDDWYYL